MNVQHWLADTPADDEATHAPVRCPACTRLHFINTSTSKLLGEKFGEK